MGQGRNLLRSVQVTCIEVSSVLRHLKYGTVDSVSDVVSLSPSCLGVGVAVPESCLVDERLGYYYRRISHHIRRDKTFLKGAGHHFRLSLVELQLKHPLLYYIRLDVSVLCNKVCLRVQVGVDHSHD